MKVILTQDVDNVGYRGDVVEVARGYARNYLLPRRLAEAATPGRLAEMERRDSLRARHEAKSVDEARELADRLAAAELRFDVKAGPTGALFGSVTPTTIADELWERLKIRVDRRKIELAEPIKRVGRYEVPIEVFPDVRVEVRTLVVPEGGELPPEAESAPESTVGDGGPVEGEAAEPETEPPVRGSGSVEGVSGEPGGSLVDTGAPDENELEPGEEQP